MDWIKQFLVGGFNPSEKYSSIGMIIPNVWENKKMFQTTNQLLYNWFNPNVPKVSKCFFLLVLGKEGMEMGKWDWQDSYYVSFPHPY